jgi:hypothetical protein
VANRRRKKRAKYNPCIWDWNNWIESIAIYQDGEDPVGGVGRS